MSFNLGVFVSGRGSNLCQIIKAIKSGFLPAKISCVISSSAVAYAQNYAREESIPYYIVEKKSFISTELFEQELNSKLEKYEISLICLAGFMHLIGNTLLTKWNIINIHPSLLPSFKGLNAQTQALEYGAKIAGCTVHYVNPKMDEGAIIAQASVPVLTTDNAETLSKRILAKEHIIYPLVIKGIALNKIKINEEKKVIIEHDFEHELLQSISPDCN